MPTGAALDKLNRAKERRIDQRAIFFARYRESKFTVVAISRANGHNVIGFAFLAAYFVAVIAAHKGNKILQKEINVYGVYINLKIL